MSEPLVPKPKEIVKYEAKYFLMSPEQKQTYLNRFWLNIHKKGPDDCWEWQGTVMDQGYGQISTRQPYYYAASARTHRVAWVVHYDSPIPKNLAVCHSCDNRVCCNPNHLFLATLKINIKDATIKGRMGGKWRQHITPREAKENLIIYALRYNEERIKEVIKKYDLYPKNALDTIKNFFPNIKDRSFLPEPLFSRYAHCKSWTEAKELKEKYAREDQLRRQEELQRKIQIANSV